MTGQEGTPTAREQAEQLAKQAYHSDSLARATLAQAWATMDLADAVRDQTAQMAWQERNR